MIAVWLFALVCSGLILMAFRDDREG